MQLLQELRNAFKHKSVVRNILFCLTVVIILHLFYSTYREGMNVRELKIFHKDNKTELIAKNNKHKSFKKFKKKFKQKVRQNAKKCKKEIKKGEDKSTCNRLTIGKKYIKDTYPELYHDVDDITPDNRITSPECENATIVQVVWSTDAKDETVNLTLGDCVEFKTDGTNTFKDHPIEIMGITGKIWVNIDDEINNFNVKPPTTGTYEFKCANHPNTMKGRLIVT
jgi:hypothetical protein